MDRDCCGGVVSDSHSTFGMSIVRIGLVWLARDEGMGNVVMIDIGRGIERPWRVDCGPS
jgi:hypothetical protein